MNDPETKRTWTFVILGGEPFQAQIAGHPRLDHDGQRTLWKAHATVPQVIEIEAAIKKHGGQVSKFTEYEGTAQPVQRASEVFRTRACPTCFWYEPQDERQCGIEVWPEETVEAALAQPKAAQDRSNCPEGYSNE